MESVQLAKLLCQYCSSWLLFREDKSRKCVTCGYTVEKGELPNVLTMRELLSGNKLEDQLPGTQANLNNLLAVMNKFRVIYGYAMVVTSGLRTLDHHLDIYKDLAKQKGIPFDQSKVPMGSQHLRGAAVDIEDKDGKLYQFCQDNLNILEDLGLWIEMKDTQKRVHFQIIKYGSWVPGKTRFFNP